MLRSLGTDSGGAAAGATGTTISGEAVAIGGLAIIGLRSNLQRSLPLAMVGMRSNVQRSLRTTTLLQTTI